MVAVRSIGQAIGEVISSYGFKPVRNLGGATASTGMTFTPGGSSYPTTMTATASPYSRSA